MKTVGIIGGIGPESTIEYYRLIITEYRKHRTDGSYPSIIINSIDMTKMLGLVAAKDIESLAGYLIDQVRKLASAGADFGALASNTPHIVFDEVRRHSPIPLLSIVEATRDVTLKLGLKRVGLFGARFTMEGKFYPDLFAHAGITIVVPEAGERDYIHDKYMSELVKGVLLPETREHLLSIVDSMKDRNDIDGLILGGTELPLILKDAEHNGVPLLDTTRIHVERIVAELLS